MDELALETKRLRLRTMRAADADRALADLCRP